MAVEDRDPILEACLPKWGAKLSYHVISARFLQRDAARLTYSSVYRPRSAAAQNRFDFGSRMRDYQCLLCAARRNLQPRLCLGPSKSLQYFGLVPAVLGKIADTSFDGSIPFWQIVGTH